MEAGECVGRVFRQADIDSLQPKQRVGDGPALVDRADKIGVGYANIVEERLAKLGSAGEIADRLHVDSGAVHRQQEKADALLRSAEHTSELQSLLRISYAVF